MWTLKCPARDWFPKFANGLNIKIDIAQKVYELWNYYFAKILPGDGKIVLAKEQFHNSYTYQSSLH